jgi:tetratricopeptide (TPR) repeat protein
VSSSAQRVLDLGLAWYRRGRFTEAIALFEAARECAEALGEHEVAALAWTHFARASSLSCEPMVAEHAFARASLAFERSGRPQQAVLARLRQGFVAYDAGALTRATELLEAELARAPERSGVRAIALGYLANVARSRGELDAAEAGYVEALTLLQSEGEALYAAAFRMDLAVLSLLRGRWAEAWERIRTARRAAESSPPDPMLSALVDHYAAIALASLGERAALEAALARFDPPRSVAMDFLAATHRVLFGESTVASLRARAPAHEHARLTLRVLRGLEGGSSRPDDRLVLFEAEQRLRVGEDIDVRFGPRSAEWRLVLALAAHRIAPDAPSLSADALVAAGWPGERLSPESAKNRLHVALAKLRKLGLRDVLLRYVDGYALSPGLVVLRLQSESENKSV